MKRIKAAAVLSAALMAFSALPALSVQAGAAGNEPMSTASVAAKDGWVTKNGKKYYYKNGKALTGKVKIDGDTYYFIASKNGQMATKFLTIGGKRYYFGKDGVMRKGWVKIGDNKYYFDSNGAAATGTKKIDGVSYKFSNDGKLIGKAKASTSSKVKFGMTISEAEKIIEAKYDEHITQDNIIIALKDIDDIDKDDVKLDMFVFGSNDKLLCYGTISGDMDDVSDFRKTLTKTGYKLIQKDVEGIADFYATDTQWAGVYEDIGGACMYVVFSPQITKEMNAGNFDSYYAFMDTINNYGT